MQSLLKSTNVKMAIISETEAGGYTAVKVDLHNSPLLMLVADKGYLMCGYLNKEVAEEQGDATAIVRGVKEPKDLLDAKVVNMTSKAAQMGVKTGMTGREALELMD